MSHVCTSGEVLMLMYMSSASLGVRLHIMCKDPMCVFMVSIMNTHISSEQVSDTQCMGYDHVRSHLVCIVYEMYVRLSFLVCTLFASLSSTPLILLELVWYSYSAIAAPAYS